MTQGIEGSFCCCKERRFRGRGTQAAMMVACVGKRWWTLDVLCRPSGQNPEDPDVAVMERGVLGKGGAPRDAGVGTLPPAGGGTAGVD